MLHCCPSGYVCNFTTHMCEKQKLPWFKIPMVMKEAEKSSARVLPAFVPREFDNNQVPAETKSPAVFCDNIYQCPSGTTCCRSRTLVWFCCSYSPVSSPVCALRLKDPVKGVGRGVNADTITFAGHLLSGWLPLLSHGLPVWLHFYLLREAEPEIPFYSQRTVASHPCCPHCCPRGKKWLAGGRKSIITVYFYIIYE